MTTFCNEQFTIALDRTYEPLTSQGFIERRLIQIEKQLLIQNNRMNEIERKLGTFSRQEPFGFSLENTCIPSSSSPEYIAHLDQLEIGLSDRLSICESKCESLGYAELELELCKGSTCIDDNNNKMVTHFPLNSKLIHLTGLGGIAIEFTLPKLHAFYNLNHLCLSDCRHVEPLRIQRYYSENNIPPLPDDAIFSTTVKTLELRHSTGFDDLKIVSRFPNLTKLIVRGCVLSEHIHLILPSINHTIKEIQFFNVRSNRDMKKYAEFEKYCKVKGITFTLV